MGDGGESTVQRDRYTLVPGMTAYRASQLVRRIIAALSLVWVALGVGVGLLVGARGRDSLTASDFLLLGIVLVTPIVAVFVLVGLVARRDRAEGAAGYTTQTSGRIAYDQVDPATGVVIRRAHSAVRTLPGSADPGSLGDVQPPGVAAPPASAASPGSVTYFAVPASGRRAAVIVYTVTAVLFVGILSAIILPIAFTQPDPSERDILLIALVASVVGVALLVAVFIALGVIAARNRIRRVAAVRPVDTLFLSPQTPELRQALKALGDAKPHLGLGGRFVVSIGFDGIQLWKGSAAEGPRFAMSWDRIDHVQAGTMMVAAGKSMVSYRTAHVFQKGEPQPIDVPLPIASPRGQNSARAPYANDVLNAMARFTTVRPAAPVSASRRR